MKKLLMGVALAAVLSVTSLGITELNGKSTAVNTQNDPGGGGWQSGSTTVADPGGGGWEPSIKSIDSTPNV